jgi:flagellar FliL protein
MSKQKEGADEEAAPKKKSKKKLIIIVLAAVLLLGGGGGAYFMLGSGSGEPAAEPPPEPGIVVPLDAITINLADGHFLKIGMALQATAAVSEELDGSKALDVAIGYLSNMEMKELSSNEGREKAKEHLVEKLAEAYEDEVMDVYFTEFVMQ